MICYIFSLLLWKFRKSLKICLSLFYYFSQNFCNLLQPERCLFQLTSFTNIQLQNPSNVKTLPCLDNNMCFLYHYSICALQRHANCRASSHQQTIQWTYLCSGTIRNVQYRCDQFGFLPVGSHDGRTGL